MGNKYTVVGNLRKPHKDCEGETLTDLSFEEAMKIESDCFIKKVKKGRQRNYGICYNVRCDCDSCSGSLTEYNILGHYCIEKELNN